MRRGGKQGRLFVLLLALSGGSAELDAAVPEAVADALRARAASKGEVRLIVEFAAPGRGFAELPAADRPARLQQIAKLQSALAQRLQQPGLREVKRFSTIPFMVFAANEAAVAYLARQPDILSLQEDLPELPALASSLPVIGAASAWAEGYDGAGQVVAVLDTGVDSTHGYFPAAKLKAEACFSTNSEPDNSQSLCPGQATSSTEPGSGKNCASNISGCSHGTHVAGIAVGNNGVGPNIGVAKGAGYISIQVFSCISSTANCTGIRSAGSYPSDQILALEHVLTLNAGFDIAAVNVSIGSSATYSSQSACDDVNVARKAAIDNLRAVGIPVVIAAGNGGRKTGLSQPGCISSAISVGNTTDADAIADTSNVSDYLDLLAPGSDIISAVPGNLEASNTGTSMAAPHVAGAFAVIRQAVPAATIDAILQALRDTGTVVDDQRPGGSITGMRRINLDSAVLAFTTLQPEVETTPEEGSLLDLGDVPVGAMGTEFQLSVSNIGEAQLDLLGCDISGAQSGNFVVVACPASVAPAASADVSLRCDPALIGELGATLTVTTNDASEAELTYTLQCTGLGVEITTVPVVGTTLNFSGVLYESPSSDLTVQVSNGGNQPLSLGCALSGSQPDQFSITACPVSVPGGGQAIVSVQCIPGSQGSFSASLELSSNDPDESLLAFPLACTGLAPEISVDPVAGSNLDFGSVRMDQQSPLQIVTITNSGDGLLMLECELAGSNPGSFAIEQCPDGVAAGNDAELQLHCQPESLGMQQAELQVSSNDADEPMLDFALMCEGLPPEVVFTDNFEADSD